MEGSTQELVRRTLRESGPLTVAEIGQRIALFRPSLSPPSSATIHEAIRSNDGLQPAGNGRYVYLPSVIRGAQVRVPLYGAAPGKGELTVGAEALALLWPDGPQAGNDPAATLQLEEGSTANVGAADKLGFPWRLRSGFGAPLHMPPTFWAWLKARQRTGANLLVLRCEDGEARQFTVKAIAAASLDAEAVAARNDELLQTAARLFRGARDRSPSDLARGLLSHGIYHDDPPPDALGSLLFRPSSPFFLDINRIAYRPDITPAIRRLLAERLEIEPEVRKLIGLPAQTPAAVAPARPARIVPPVAGSLYSIKVSLDRDTWRVIEILDDQTLQDLHDAIQSAFDWDDDHLFSFFLSGRRWDNFTEIQGTPFGDPEQSPGAEEVTLAALELKPRQKFLYLFDYGDQIQHSVELLRVSAAPPSGDFPRIAESHGEAPAQYPNRDEDDEED